MIFACSDSKKLQNAAKHIGTSCIKLTNNMDETVSILFALVQARLRNFPALITEGSDKVPQLAPLSMQLEFMQNKHNQTVTLIDGHKVLFTPFQLNSWEKLFQDYSITISAPTSAGKSYTLLLYIMEKFKKKSIKSCVYLVPTRALINQVSNDALAAFDAGSIDDVVVTTAPVPMGGSNKSRVLYVLTQERLENLLISYPNVMIDMVIIDEAQMITDNTRGVLLESVLDRIWRIKPSTQFIFSGPLIGNPDYFSQIFQFDKYAICATDQSPVTQNIIFLDYELSPISSIKVSLKLHDVKLSIGELELPIKLYKDVDKLSYLSSIFGRSGSNIIYAAGKAHAEQVAILLSQSLPEDKSIEEDLSELIKFVKKHVHKDYALVETLKKGVGFHYGHMPSLLRKNLEDYFKAKKILYLVCTSTLLYGLNMPAKNIFMLKPTTGKGTPISGPDFWNLAGRAGRLGKELEGNVFIIDYDKWESAPISETKNVHIESALKSTIINDASNFLDYINNSEAPSEKDAKYEIAFGKLIIDHRLEKLTDTIARYENNENKIFIEKIAAQIDNISNNIPLPFEVINKNIGVSVFRQLDLFNYFNERLGKLPPEELIPAFPLSDFKDAFNNYIRAFRRIHTYILKYPSSNKSHTFFARLALRWMRGDSLPELISMAIQYHKKQKKNTSTATIIRNTMEDIENQLRFRYVKFFTCYNSILTYSLNIKGFNNYIGAIPDIPLYLEMGASSGAMINLMALGLSRITSESLMEYITDKDSSIDDLRIWLKSLKLETLDISLVCLEEAKRLIQTI